MKKKNIQVALRIDDEARSAMDFLAAEWNVTVSEAIRRAVVAAAATELKRETDEANDAV
jgi:hypothetical protein